MPNQEQEITRIVTQNCFGRVLFFNAPARLKVIASHLLELSPDVMFLQEATRIKWVEDTDFTGYQKLYSPRRVILDGLLLTLVRDDLPVRDVKFTKFRKQGKFGRGILGLEQYSDMASNKGILDVTLENGLHLINLHFLATYTPSFSEDKHQLDQIHQFLDYVSSLNKVIAAGDCNFDEDSPYYKLLTSQLQDLTRRMGPSSLNNYSSGRKLDFIFTKGIHSKVKKVEYIDYPNKPYPSDHKGIVLDMD